MNSLVTIEFEAGTRNPGQLLHNALLLLTRNKFSLASIIAIYQAINKLNILIVAALAR